MFAWNSTGKLSFDDIKKDNTEEIQVAVTGE